MVVARWVKVEGKKAAIRDDGLLLLIEHGIECLSLCHAEGAGAGLFDISVLLWGDGASTFGCTLVYSTGQAKTVNFFKCLFLFKEPRNGILQNKSPQKIVQTQI
jgi:hypothetical protein